MQSKKWLKWFEEMACFIAKKSKDKSTKVGAVIIDEDNTVISCGYNGIVRGVNDNIEERHKRPIKYLHFEHAERNAIYNAARQVLKGKTLVMNYAPCPCADCARAIIQSGIKRVVGYKSKLFTGKGKNWDDSLAASKIMLEEARIEVIELEDDEPTNTTKYDKVRILSFVDIPHTYSIEVFLRIGHESVIKSVLVLNGNNLTHYITADDVFYLIKEELSDYNLDKEDVCKQLNKVQGKYREVL